MMRLAFVFVLIGFGTKAGFAPLHTWLADAHSQAPSPVSGVLSGVLLACALYGILRFHTLTAAATGSTSPGNLLLAFGVLSVAVAAPFILVQRDLKRLLAYSSVEHIGLMAVAFGIGGPLGAYAALLHLVNHAATKALLFFVAGDVVQRFGTRRISAIRGGIRVGAAAPAGCCCSGVLAITGAPPSASSSSEFGIVGAGFAGDRCAAIARRSPSCFLLALIFAGMLGPRAAAGLRRSPARRRDAAPWQRCTAPGALACLARRLAAAGGCRRCSSASTSPARCPTSSTDAVVLTPGVRDGCDAGPE